MQSRIPAECLQRLKSIPRTSNAKRFPVCMYVCENTRMTSAEWWCLSCLKEKICVFPRNVSVSPPSEICTDSMPKTKQTKQKTNKKKTAMLNHFKRGFCFFLNNINVQAKALLCVNLTAIFRACTLEQTNTTCCTHQNTGWSGWGPFRLHFDSTSQNLSLHISFLLFSKLTDKTKTFP